MYNINFNDIVILDVDEYYDIGESVHHSGGQQPVCEGNETHLMQCTMMSTTNSDCHPVLVKCARQHKGELVKKIKLLKYYYFE